MASSGIADISSESDVAQTTSLTDDPDRLIKGMGVPDPGGRRRYHHLPLTHASGRRFQSCCAACQLRLRCRGWLRRPPAWVRDGAFHPRDCAPRSSVERSAGGRQQADPRAPRPQFQIAVRVAPPRAPSRADRMGPSCTRYDHPQHSGGRGQIRRASYRASCRCSHAAVQRGASWPALPVDA